MPTYSIIVPVYNAEKYLESCIDSVLTQSSAHSYEVILVNDGSVDASPGICDRYAQHFSNVKVIHQINQGVSAARNAGIAAASGAYVLLLDADDYWDARALQLLDELIPQQPDIIEFGYQTLEGGKILSQMLPAVEVTGKTGVEYFEVHSKMNRIPIGSSCAAAFRRQLLETHNIRFPLGISYGEDLDFHMHCLKHAKSVFSICQPLYWYRMNEASATHTPSVKKTGDVLSVCAKVYRLFPSAMLANYYCLNIPHIANLTRKDAGQLKGLLRENQDILRSTSGKSARIARILYKIFGWYYASRLIQFGVNVRHAKKG